MRTFLLITQCVAIALLILETGYVFVRCRTRIQQYLFLICLSTLTNSVGYFVAIQANTMNEYLVGLKWSYMGRVWVPFFLLLFTNALCKKKNPVYLMLPLSAVHLSIFLIMSSCEYHSLYYKNMYLDTSGLFPCLGKQNGIVHQAYNLLIIVYIIYGVVQLIRATIREKKSRQKIRLFLVLAAIVSESGLYLVEIFGNTVGFDDTVLGYAIGAVFMGFAIFRYSLMDTLKIVGDYVVDEVSEGIIVVNKAGDMEYFNKPASRIFPYLERDSYEIVAKIKKAIDDQTSMTLDGRIYTPERRDLIDEGSVNGTIYVLVDDTETYHYMDELKKQKEIAEEANASKSAFLSVVSHEIRTPMNAVVGMTDLLLREREKLTEKQEKYLKNIQTSGSSLVMIVNDILDQSKIEAGKMEIVEDAYEIRPLTEDVKMIIENRIGSKPIELICDIDKNVPDSLIGDGLRIRQILINLMNNAVKFTDEGFIKLSIKLMEDAAAGADGADRPNGADRLLLRFGVSDSGQGIKAEDLSKLGQAFSQVDTKRNHSKEGTGLGLSISRDFIKMMGGQLEVVSEYGKGSEFFFTIEQGIILENRADSENENNARSEDRDFTAPDAKVLVVDDNEINLMLMEESLSILEMTVHTAQSGQEALTLVKENEYHLIFMDYVMPNMDGVETTEKIRELSLKIPIIALTGDSSEETREKFIKAGIDDFTDKPVDIKKLKRKLVKWLPTELIK